MGVNRISLRICYGSQEYDAQVQAGWELMLRYREYAQQIGCTTYAEVAMWDSIECNEQQALQLAQWWEANTRRTTQ